MNLVDVRDQALTDGRFVFLSLIVVLAIQDDSDQLGGGQLLVGIFATHQNTNSFLLRGNQLQK